MLKTFKITMANKQWLKLLHKQYAAYMHDDSKYLFLKEININGEDYPVCARCRVKYSNYEYQLFVDYLNVSSDWRDTIELAIESVKDKTAIIKKGTPIKVVCEIKKYGVINNELTDKSQTISTEDILICVGDTAKYKEHIIVSCPVKKCKFMLKMDSITLSI